MGFWHAHYAKMAGARIVCVVDLDESKASKLALKYDAEWGSELEKCLQSSKTVDVIHVCTPASSHLQQVEAALCAGSHALVEKPLAVSVSDTEHLMRLAQEQELLVCPVHQFPFQRGFLQLKERLPTLGELVRIQYITCSAGGQNKTLSEQRSILLEIVPHPVSLFCHLLAKQIGTTLDFDAINIVAFNHDFLELSTTMNGCVLSIVISLAGRPTRNELTVIGSRGSCTVDLFHGFAVFEDGRVSRMHKILRPLTLSTKMLARSSTNLARRAILAESAYPGLPQLISQFYAAVRQKQELPISESEVLASARLIDRLRSAALNESSCPHPLPE